MAEDVLEKIDTPKPKRSLGKLLLLGLNAVLFVSGACFFLLIKFGVIANPMGQSAASTSPRAIQNAAASAQAVKDADAKLVSVRMRPFVINLSGNQGQRFLRLVMELEVKSEKAKEVIETRTAAIRDRLIFLIGGKTFGDISTTEGKYQLQTEIGQTINDLLGAPLVVKTYFTEFIVQ